MTMTTPIPTVADHGAEPDVRLVPVPSGAGVSLADRLLMRVGLALLLATSRRAARPARAVRPARTVLPGRPGVETARPFC